MRSLTMFFLLLMGFTAIGSLAHAQVTEPANQVNANQVAANQVDGSTSVSATKEEVNQLRREVAAQRQTIEELKALVEKLAEAQTTARAQVGSTQIQPALDAAATETNSRPATVVAVEARQVSSPAAGGARLRNAVYVEANPAPAAVVVTRPPSSKNDTPLTSGSTGSISYQKSRRTVEQHQSLRLREHRLPRL